MMVNQDHLTEAVIAMTDVPQYQQIEDAYKGVAEVIDKLPESTETRRATEHLKLSESYTIQARERVKPDRTEAVQSGLPVDSSASLRGPAMPGWPWGLGWRTSWRWMDAATPRERGEP